MTNWERISRVENGFQIGGNACGCCEETKNFGVSWSRDEITAVDVRDLVSNLKEQLVLAEELMVRLRALNDDIAEEVKNA